MTYTEVSERRHQKQLDRMQEHKERAQEKYARLQKAVRELYKAAYWHADRPCDAERLWTEVRDAAGITPGTGSAIL